MNVLPREKQAAVISGLIEGSSIRSVERVTGVHRDTIMRLLRRVGANCERIMDREMRGVRVRRVEADELWTFCRKKERRLSDQERALPDFGDQYVFIALDPESKLVPAFAVGKRDVSTAVRFMADLATKVGTQARIQISTDAFAPYREAVERAFGSAADYAMVVKTFAAENPGPGRYAPPKVAEVVSTVVSGDPDEAWISTSHVERWNWSMRTQCRRFTRLAAGFSRNLDNLKAATALAVTAYNFVKVHRSLRMTPAMAAGVTDHLWAVAELLAPAPSSHHQSMG
ncbi:MAG TPA: IS1 family transposase [Candidatus Acidoferrales bacterium]|nr:IS1 family transposase [Candidatus Acidoferrales bacterium]